MSKVADGIAWAWMGLAIGLAAPSLLDAVRDIAPVVPIFPTIDPISPEVSGLQAVVIYETNPDVQMPPKQAAILSSPIVRGWLTDNAAKDAGGQPMWRFLDDDSEFADPANPIAAALQRPREGLPWLIVTNDGTGFEGPLPENVDDMMELLEKYK